MAPVTAQTIPVTLVTGFLGAGKTTLLNQLGAAGALHDTLVVINEFGQVGLDHLLMIEAKEDLLVELSGGCVCCTLHGDLSAALVRELDSRSTTDRPPFSRVVIETSGVSDPSSIALALAVDAELSERFHLQAVITVIDAAAGAENLLKHDEAAAQVALADLIVVSKSALVAPAVVASLRADVEERNPFARIVGSDGECVLPADVFDPDLCLRRPLLLLEDPPPMAMMAGAGAGGLLLGAATAAPAMQAHAGRYQVMSFHAGEPVAKATLDAWLWTAMSLLGERILRFKAIVDVQGQPAPTVLHGVQGLISPEARLDTWPTGQRRSRMVFITDQVPEEVVKAALDAFFPGVFVQALHG